MRDVKLLAEKSYSTQALLTKLEHGPLKGLLLYFSARVDNNGSVDEAGGIKLTDIKVTVQTKHYGVLIPSNITIGHIRQLGLIQGNVAALEYTGQSVSQTISAGSYANMTAAIYIPFEDVRTGDGALPANEIESISLQGAVAKRDDSGPDIQISEVVVKAYGHQVSGEFVAAPRKMELIEVDDNPLTVQGHGLLDVFGTLPIGDDSSTQYAIQLGSKDISDGLVPIGIVTANMLDDLDYDFSSEIQDNGIYTFHRQPMGYKVSKLVEAPLTISRVDGAPAGTYSLVVYRLADPMGQIAQRVIRYMGITPAQLAPKLKDAPKGNLAPKLANILRPGRIPYLIRRIP